VYVVAWMAWNLKIPRHFPSLIFETGFVFWFGEFFDGHKGDLMFFGRIFWVFVAVFGINYGAWAMPRAADIEQLRHRVVEGEKSAMKKLQQQSNAWL
jgi:hypothetical protein